jgi:hypothetical protein
MDEPSIEPAEKRQMPPNAAHKRKAGEHMTEQERIELGSQIADMRFQGATFKTIAKSLEMNERTARKLLSHFQDVFGKEYLKDQKALLYDFKRYTEYTQQAHLAEYAASAAKSKDKVGKSEILYRGSQVVFGVFDRLQSAGFLPKVKEKVEVSGEKTWNVTIRRVSNADKAK